MFDEYDFSLGEIGGTGQRKAFRTRIPGLEISLKATGESFVVLDLSATGLAFRKPRNDFRKDTRLEFDLLLNKKLFIPGLKADIMRVCADGLVGLGFADNDRRQEARLDKLVLEVQKRMIALRKKAGKQGT
ncbi:PilZ domain-containing protein [Desulfobaculum bizertense]|uniref:PilZ domain-containing protein n=1 Tax=Desulfobaculum bizertense DSM 18034 TaxID=1121442 RepID=A0A1T4W8H1_9BACT|nr:PilZ domain-containing protein [Desulfobaculum bizertense]UIJ39195.1 PilZ domain-containing protein [Desulfobaculum bizertense]SKA73580.1 PilZ domain-containing protein [Desulfobaculum bizertense DSM 18034]